MMNHPQKITKKVTRKISNWSPLQLVALAVLTLFLVASCSEQPPSPQSPPSQKLVDDWEYDGPSEEDGGSFLSKASSIVSSPNRFMAASAPTMAESAIGFSVGGAKDINNFRENIENNYFPITTDITYEGLFYDYYFDTGEQEPCTELFCPSYAYAASADPFSDSIDEYLTVGLNSGIQDFQRKKLNLVIVLDISGSMHSPFNSYYYDQFTKDQAMTAEEKEEREKEERKSKMTIANEAVVALLGHLKSDDKFGMVVFDDVGYLAKPLSSVASTDMKAVTDHVLELEPQGGTNMEAGMALGTGLFDDVDLGDPDEYETRIIFITDAMPNTGVTDEEGLFGMFKKNANKGIYTTFIGVGVDLNTELIERLTKMRGANYYSVHSAKDFKKRMDEGFEYMVTPLVFGLELTLDAVGYDIEKVYGSPEASESTGEIMKVNTLFPSPKEDGETKGGVVLLKLKKTAEDGRLVLRVSYEDRLGKKYQNKKEVMISTAAQDQDDYPNTGIRKAILLSRYADLAKSWIADERPEEDKTIKRIPGIYLITREHGIVACTIESGCLPPDEDLELGRWERPSVPLSVSPHYQGLFADFSEYFEAEMKRIGDETLKQELRIVEKLATVQPVEESDLQLE